jgi:hypothetical protein
MAGGGRKRDFIARGKARAMGRSSLCAGRPIRRSESERKSRPAPFEMTVRVGAKVMSELPIGIGTGAALAPKMRGG